MSVAVVEKASSEHQRVFTGSLCDLPDIVSRNGVTAPATIIVGHVVGVATGQVPQALPQQPEAGTA